MRRTYVRYPEGFKEKVIRLVLDGHKTIGEISKEYNIARSTVDIWCKNKCIKNNKVSINIDCSDVRPNFNYEVPDPNIDIAISSEDEKLLKEIKITQSSLEEMMKTEVKELKPKELLTAVSNNIYESSEDEVDILIKAIHIITKRLQGK